jgi:hypothetical protein
MDGEAESFRRHPEALVTRRLVLYPHKFQTAKVKRQQVLSSTVSFEQLAMKPQNYSLKFQNSLADCRITPGSQHLVSRNKAVVPNGQRASRRPTKAELRKSQGKVAKAVNTRRSGPASSSSTTPLVQLLSKKAQKKAQAQAYAEQRAMEKKREVEIAASSKGVWELCRVHET